MGCLCMSLYMVGICLYRCLTNGPQVVPGYSRLLLCTGYVGKVGLLSLRGIGAPHLSTICLSKGILLDNSVDRVAENLKHAKI